MPLVFQNPEQIHNYFIGALLKKDIKGALSLYHSDATFVLESGVAKGHKEIEPCLREFMALAPSMQLVDRTMSVADDLALVKMKWQLEGSPDVFVAMDVLRRLEDGRWVFQIDNPYGQ